MSVFASKAKYFVVFGLVLYNSQSWLKLKHYKYFDKDKIGLPSEVCIISQRIPSVVVMLFPCKGAF